MSNLSAFLQMIATSEGTANLGDRGYNVLVGSTPSHPVLFNSYADHPRIHVKLNATLYSTAAGRYQILERIYDAYKKRLKLEDFSSDSQDAIALEMLRECGARPYIQSGHFDEAVSRCSHLWASLPGAAYGQHTNLLADLRKTFTTAGGILA